MITMTILQQTPTKDGYYGLYGGQHIPPALKEIFDEIAGEYDSIVSDTDFIAEHEELLSTYIGRPSALYFARNMTADLGGAKIYLKREDLNHTGAHKINHTLGEALLAKRMGKTKLLAETGAGQHGVALATAAALVGLDCEIHMGQIDVQKQQPNVMRMKLLGATVVEVTNGGRCLKDAVDSAFGAFMEDPQNIFFAIGSVVGPHPYPMIVRDFQTVIGREAKEQIMHAEKKLPDYLIACVGGGCNAIGLFHDFLGDESVQMIGVEPSGTGLEDGKHAATMTCGTPGHIHGMYTYTLQNESGEPLPVHSVASGLDYPGVSPIHAHLKDAGRVQYATASDDQALHALQYLSKTEGIIPALESSHAIAHAMELAPTLPSDSIIIVNVSGRGDKDLEYIRDHI